VPPPPTRFWLCAGAPDCQDLLKYEVLSRHPELRFAFSRPGLITFKAERDLTAGAPIDSHLAVLSGLSLGGAKTLDDIAPVVQKAWPSPPELRAYAWPTAEDDEPNDPSELVHVEEHVRAQLETAPSAEHELGILVPPALHPEYGYWAFVRATGAPTLTERVTPPEASPSRAYSKLVEALTHFQIRLEAGQSVLELGAAPGGATLALLERGMSVVAVDPAKMDARLAPTAEEKGLFLRHIERTAQSLTAADVSGVPSPVRWLVSDMNVAPPIAVQQILRARALVKKTLRGAILTLKLNDTAAVDTLPKVLMELEQAFGQAPKVAHLPSHRREVVAVIGG
jgi:23S rRNA (cytidine2498-2'-O)-methyltransferase